MIKKISIRIIEKFFCFMSKEVRGWEWIDFSMFRGFLIIRSKFKFYFID